MVRYILLNTVGSEPVLCLDILLNTVVSKPVYDPDLHTELIIKDEIQ